MPVKNQSEYDSKKGNIKVKPPKKEGKKNG